MAMQRSWPNAALALVASALLGACVEQGSQTRIDHGSSLNTAYAWNLPAHVPLPVEPEFNPMTEQKFQLGRHLFYDERLSANRNLSCASCHHQDKAFADGVALPVGTTGQRHTRNSQALINVAWFSTLNWGNPVTDTLERQIEGPLFGDDPIEHGINEENKAAILAELRADEVYQRLFGEAFRDEDDPFHYNNIIFALASFVRGLTSWDSPFDRYQSGDASAMSPAALRGMNLFNSERLECFHCHGGYNLTNSVMDRTRLFPERNFHNTGLYNLDGQGAYPEPNTGVHEVTQDPRHMGQMRTPTLRNIALTAPYSHDGSHATLDDIIDTYAAGGRNISSGPLAGDGRLNPLKDGFIVGFELSVQERADLLAFLHSLTDVGFVSNSRFSDPWPTE